MEEKFIEAILLNIRIWKKSNGPIDHHTIAGFNVIVIAANKQTNKLLWIPPS